MGVATHWATFRAATTANFTIPHLCGSLCTCIGFIILCWCGILLGPFGHESFRDLSHLLGLWYCAKISMPDSMPPWAADIVHGMPWTAPPQTF